MPERIISDLTKDLKVTQKELTNRVKKATHDELLQLASDLAEYSWTSVVVKKPKQQIPKIETSMLPSGEIDSNGEDLLTPVEHIADNETYHKIDKSNLWEEFPVFLEQKTAELAYQFHSQIDNPMTLSPEYKYLWLQSLGKHQMKVLTLLVNHYYRKNYPMAENTSLLDSFNSAIKSYPTINSSQTEIILSRMYDIFQGRWTHYVPDLKTVAWVDYRDFRNYLLGFHDFTSYSFRQKKQVYEDVIQMYKETKPNPKQLEEMQTALLSEMYQDNTGKFTAYAYQDAALGLLAQAKQARNVIISQKVWNASASAESRKRWWPSPDFNWEAGIKNDKLNSDISLYESTISNLEEIITMPTSDLLVWDNFIQGFCNWIGIPVVASLQDLAYSFDVYLASKSDTPSDAQIFLLKSITMLSSMQEFTPRAYRVWDGVGSTVTQLPEFMLTAWVYKVGEMWVVQFAKHMMRKWVLNYVEKSTLKTATKWWWVLAGSAIQSTVLLHGAVKVWLDRMSTPLQVSIDPATGEVLIDNIRDMMWNKLLGESVITAMSKGFMTNWMQMLTERMWFDTGKLVSKAMPKLFSKALTRKVQNIVAKWEASNYEQAWQLLSKQLQKSMALTDPLWEYYEEFLSTRLSDLWTGDKKIWDIDGKQEVDTLWICSLFGGMMWSVNVSMRQIMRQADQWYTIPEQFTQLANGINTVNDLHQGQMILRANGLSAVDINNFIKAVVGKFVKIIPQQASNLETKKNKGKPEQIKIPNLPSMEIMMQNSQTTNKLELDPQNPLLLKQYAALLGVKVSRLTDARVQAIISAHKSPGSLGNLTMAQIKIRYEILQKAWFTRSQIQILMDNWYVGDVDFNQLKSSFSDPHVITKIDELEQFKLKEENYPLVANYVPWVRDKTNKTYVSSQNTWSSLKLAGQAIWLIWNMASAVSWMFSSEAETLSWSLQSETNQNTRLALTATITALRSPLLKINADEVSWDIAWCESKQRHANLCYRIKLFDEFSWYYANILDTVKKDPEATLSDIPNFTVDDKAGIIIYDSSSPHHWEARKILDKYTDELKKIQDQLLRQDYTKVKNHHRSGDKITGKKNVTDTQKISIDLKLSNGQKIDKEKAEKVLKDIQRFVWENTKIKDAADYDMYVDTASFPELKVLRESLGTKFIGKKVYLKEWVYNPVLLWANGKVDIQKIIMAYHNLDLLELLYNDWSKIKGNLRDPGEIFWGNKEVLKAIRKSKESLLQEIQKTWYILGMKTWIPWRDRYIAAIWYQNLAATYKESKDPIVKDYWRKISKERNRTLSLWDRVQVEKIYKSFLGEASEWSGSKIRDAYEGKWYFSKSILSFLPFVGKFRILSWIPKIFDVVFASERFTTAFMMASTLIGEWYMWWDWAWAIWHTLLWRWSLNVASNGATMQKFILAAYIIVRLNLWSDDENKFFNKFLDEADKSKQKIEGTVDEINKELPDWNIESNPQETSPAQGNGWLPELWEILLPSTSERIQKLGTYELTDLWSKNTTAVDEILDNASLNQDEKVSQLITKWYIKNQ